MTTPKPMTLQRLLPVATALATALAVLAAAPAGAAVVADTGVPDGLGAPLVLDGANSYAGRIHLGARQDIRGIEAYLDGGSAGETFTLAVYDDSAGQLPGSLLYSATASYAAAGWNGLTGLAGWTVTDRSDVWVAIEVGPTDTLGSASLTGALLPTFAPSPLASTAFNPGARYQASAAPLGFGLRVSAVPEPAAAALWLAGLALFGLAAGTRRRG